MENLTNLAADQLAFQRAHALDEQNPIQMINLVQERTGQQAVALQVNSCVRGIPGIHNYAHRAGDSFNEIGEGKTTLLVVLCALRLGNSWIDKDYLLPWIFAGGGIDHRHLFHDADLRRGQAETLVKIHGLEQVCHELVQAGGVEFRDRIAGCLEAPVRIENDVSNHQSVGSPEPDNVM
jgi:hypothetical protein